MWAVRAGAICELSGKRNRRGAMEFKFEGNALFVEEAYLEAAACYTRALEAQPQDADALSKRAAAYLKLHKLQEAAADASRAAELDASLHMAHLRQGCVHVAFPFAFSLEQYVEAKRAFQRGKQAAPKANEALAKRFLTWLRKCDAELDSTFCWIPKTSRFVKIGLVDEFIVMH
ncbi:hypothetical protein BBJ28_00006224 [Nothophytophthora sp. Chile5]|nr:hypothetical protein BBJ28_00006224 [Nothophytophthora sp. Chile5]